MPIHACEHSMFAIGRRAPRGICVGVEVSAQEQTAGMGLMAFQQALDVPFRTVPRRPARRGIVLIWAAWPPVPKEGISTVNEKTIEEEALGYEVSDDAVEAAGTRSIGHHPIDHRV